MGVHGEISFSMGESDCGKFLVQNGDENPLEMGIDDISAVNMFRFIEDNSGKWIRWIWDPKLGDVFCRPK